MIWLGLWWPGMRRSSHEMTRGPPTIGRLMCGVLLFVLQLCAVQSQHLDDASPSALWMELNTTSLTSSLFSFSFSDHVAVVDTNSERIHLSDAFNNDGTFLNQHLEIDYTQFDHTSTAQTLRISSSASSSNISGRCGCLRRAATTTDVEIVLMGGYQTSRDNLISNMSLVNVSDLSIISSASMPEALAWSAIAYDDVQDVVYLYGGTNGATTADSGDLWMLRLASYNASTGISLQPLWQNMTWNCSGTRPPPLSGARMVLDTTRNQLILFGGFSCTLNYVIHAGGSACFSSALWILSLSSYSWTSVANNNQSSGASWPAARAWHTMSLFQDRIFVMGGKSMDTSFSTFVFNDVFSFNLITNQWSMVSTQGARPPAMYAHSSTLISSNAGSFLFFIGGVRPSVASNSIFALKLDDSIQASQCQILSSSILSVTAGQTTALLVQCVAWIEQLSFQVFVLNQLDNVSWNLPVTVVALSGGQYAISFIAYGNNFTFSSYSTSFVSISVLLNSVDIAGSPVQIPITPAQLLAAETLISSINAVQAHNSWFILQPCDLYGNVASIALNVSRVTVLIGGQIPQQLSIIATDDGEYQVTYIAPKQASFLLDVQFDGQAVKGSPFAVQAATDVDIDQRYYIALAVLASVWSVLVWVCFGLMMYNRSHPMFRAASPVFLALILAGCQIALISSFVPPPTDTSTSTAFLCSLSRWSVSQGFTLVFTALVLKTWRIVRIFTRKKLLVTSLTDGWLLLPMLLMAVTDLLLNLLWHWGAHVEAVTTVWSTTPLITYVSCNQQFDMLGNVLFLVPKILLLHVASMLASRTSDVPEAFNESRWVYLIVYNVAICGMIVLGSERNFQWLPSTTYLMQGLIIQYCAVSTALLLIIPKLMMLDQIQATDVYDLHGMDPSIKSPNHYGKHRESTVSKYKTRPTTAAPSRPYTSASRGQSKQTRNYETMPWESFTPDTPNEVASLSEHERNLSDPQQSTSMPLDGENQRFAVPLSPASASLASAMRNSRTIGVDSPIHLISPNKPAPRARAKHMKHGTFSFESTHRHERTESIKPPHFGPPISSSASSVSTLSRFDSPSAQSTAAAPRQQGRNSIEVLTLDS